MAAVFASSGFQVVGLDINQTIVEALNSGHAPVNETGLQELIDESKDRLTATVSYQDVVKKSQISFLILPTPSQEDGYFSNDFLLQAMQSIGECLRSKKDYHLIVITSTTMPGSTEGIIRQTLEQASGKVIGEELGLCYSPEFIALGSVIQDMLHPDFVLIGESDRKAGNLLQSIYEKVCLNEPQIRRMNFTNAELTKIAVNTFVTTKISYANMLAEYCELLPNADAAVVTKAVGSDTRIGSKYLKAAIGYGGPCFPRDNKAFSALGREIGARADIAEATDRINDHQIRRLIKAVTAFSSPGDLVAVLGLSYKPDTEVTEQSQGLQVAQLLSNQGYRIQTFDPEASLDNTNPGLLTSKTNIAETISGVNVIVLATPWPLFKGIETVINEQCEQAVVIDPWRIVDATALPAKATLVQMGISGPAS